MKITVIAWLNSSFEEFLKLQKLGLSDKLVELLRDMKRHPFEGLGKPEPLRHNLSNYWSRRIDSRYRIVYFVSANQLNIVAFTEHYQKKRSQR
jgi:toxin YoeB